MNTAGREVEHGHALVMGGSMAGLLAARVLSERFDKVTIVERDVLPRQPEQRRGVPQGLHTHGLLAGGREALETLFPGISEALVEAGCVMGDVVRDCRWYFEGACLARPASGLHALFVSRPMLEAMVRELTLALPNVRLRENTAVAGLVATDDGSRIRGIRSGAEMLSTDLVVDATGRGSRTPQWLKELGYDSPEQETVQAELRYTTRLFRRRSDHLGGDLGAIIGRTPQSKRGGVMIAQENDRWTVTLIGCFGQEAPDDLEGFIEFARTLPAPYIYDVVRRAEPIGDAARTKFPASVRRRYENLSRFPAGYLVIGDALCSFNPMYGQGMSVAALEALELEKCLAENPPDLAREFFARASKTIDIPWGVAAGADLRFPEAQGRRTARVKFANWYISKLHKAGHTDPQCTLAFHRVGNLMAAPQTIMRPGIAVRVLRHNLTARRTPQQVPDRAIAAAG
jgi:2-polyprenyl-6-methoxyphenol hydroxylase-like FAD-dependent oxidoreductase